MFEYIGSGASRKVYQINDYLVMKLPKDPTSKWDIQQCKNEIEVYLKYKNTLPLCKIYVDLCTDERIIMESVKAMNRIHDFEDRFEYHFDDLLEAIAYQHDDVSSYLNLFKNNRPVLNFAKKLTESGLTAGELSSILYDVSFDNCGYNDDGEIVILDYGLIGDW